MHCSYLLFLFISILTVFSNIKAASVHKRSLLPSNVKLELKLGKGSAVKNVAPSDPSEGRKTVLNSPLGLASLTITTNHKTSQTNANTNYPINESNKPFNPETENIFTNNNMKNPPSTLGGKGDAFFGPSYPPPHGGFGPPPHSHMYPGFGPPPPGPPHFHHSHHYPPSPHHHFHPYPHEHHPDCNHEEPFHSTDSNTKVTPIVPEKKPDAKVTPTPTSNEKIPQSTNGQSTTENVDALIDDIFGGSSTQPSTTKRAVIDINDREQTGEDKLDVRMPFSR